MTRKQWYADEQNLAGLREGLANPYVQKALAVVAEESRPNYQASHSIAVSRNAADSASALSAIQLLQAGMNRSLEILDSLQRMPPVRKVNEEPAPFDHIGNPPTTATATP